MRMQLRGLVLTALVGGFGLACGGTEPGPKPVAGDLILSIVTPSQTDGALLLSVSGGPVEAVTATGTLQVSGAPSGTGYRLVVTGNVTNGDFARIRVPDVAKVTSYVVSVEQVANRNTFILRDPAGTSVAIRR